MYIQLSNTYALSLGSNVGGEHEASKSGSAHTTAGRGGVGKPTIKELWAVLLAHWITAMKPDELLYFNLQL